MEVYGSSEIDRFYKDKDDGNISGNEENYSNNTPDKLAKSKCDQNYNKNECVGDDGNFSLDGIDNENFNSEGIKDTEKIELPLGWKNSKTISKKKYADISKDLEKYDFPDIVKTKANLLATQLKLKPHKNKPKLQQIFFLISSAYAECNLLCEDNRIARELGLKQTDINQSRAIYSQVRTGYERPIVPCGISNWILTHISDIGLNEDLRDDIDHLITSILIKEKNLRNEESKITAKAKKIKDNYPQDIALAGILYQLEMKGILDDTDRKSKEKLILLLGRKTTIVCSLLNYMKKIDNN